MKGNLQRAFTIIELLAVVAVIGLLAALLLPAINRGLHQGRTSSCLNNLKQIGSIMLLYASDNEGRMPVLDKIDRYLDEYGMSRNDTQGKSLSWTCPARNRSLAYVTEPNPINYTGNRNALAWVTNEPPKRLSLYRNPSTVLMLADGRENFAWGSWIFIDNYGASFEYFDETEPLDRGFNDQAWFQSRGFSRTDTVYIAQADVDAEGAPSGIRYRHNANAGTVVLYGAGNAAYAPKNTLQKGNFITLW